MKIENKEFSYIVAIGIFAIFVLLIMFLWNLLIPNITGWKQINYWQALGFAVLFRLLCGHFRFFNEVNHHHRHHRRMKGMSKDEREAFIRKRFQNLTEDE